MTFQKAIAILLVLVSLVSVLGACTQEPPGTLPETSESEAETTEQQIETPPREIYEDLSMNVPAYTDPGTKTCTVQSEGASGAGQLHLDFSELRGEYVVSSTKINFSCHDVASCESCGYVNTEQGGAYLISSDGLDQGGITVTLATPILASTVTGMTLTFMTTADAPTSSMRILSADQTNNAAFLNECAPMGGAAMQWTTVDLGVKDFAEMADSDGYIRSFQMYFRNKNKVDCYVQSIDFAFSPTSFLIVEGARGNCFFKQGAVESIAEIIKERFTAAGISATITVEGLKYRKNSTTAEGSLSYRAVVTFGDGTQIKDSHIATVPPVTGVWLDGSDGQYGSSHDSKGQWQQTFDPSGLLFLTDNVLSCDEGIKAVQYALVASDRAFDDEQVVWIAPQLLEMSSDGLSHLFINAFLDYGNLLVEGQAYRLMVRGVTNRDNYMLHIDIPFTYTPLSVGVTDVLSVAQEALEQASFICPADVENKQEYVKEQFEALINQPSIKANVEVLGEGLESMRIRVSLQYSEEIREARLPVYELDGRVIADVYNYAGKAFTKEAVTVKYSDKQSVISLTAPYDGDRHVILAADVIYAHAKAPLDVVQSVHYGYMKGEYCTPVPVTLTWTDANAAQDKSYTVLVSENRDMSNAIELTVTGTSAQIEHLNIGKSYYWQVKSGADSSPVQIFTTEDGYPRFVRLDGVSNVRDIGGYLTADGKRVKQNLAYRSAQLESITDEARELALNTLHIRTDLDLRGGSTAPLGNTVQHISVGMQWYEHIFDEKNHEVVRKTISTFAKEENYPIIFHCSMGRDRTGTTTFLILGLLGVDEDTLRHEYYASFFSTQGAFDPNEFPLLITNMNRLVKGFEDYGDEDDTLQQRIQAYLLDIGVTEEEIASIREIWLE